MDDFIKYGFQLQAQHNFTVYTKLSLWKDKNNWAKHDVKSLPCNNSS